MNKKKRLIGFARSEIAEQHRASGLAFEIWLATDPNGVEHRVALLTPAKFSILLGSEAYVFVAEV